MTGKTHRAIALSTSITVGVVAIAVTQKPIIQAAGTLLVPMLWVPMSAPGGYLPDIDKKGTTAYKWFKKYHLIFYILITLSLFVLPWYLAATFLVTFLIFEVMILKCVHRRETHSILFMIVMTLFFYFISTLLIPIHYYVHVFTFNLLFGLVIGSISHAFADMWNKKRVHIFFPLEILFASKDRPRFILPHFGKIVTGTPDEELFKKRWFIMCIIIASTFVIPSGLNYYIGVRSILLSEIIIVIALLSFILFLWKFMSRTMRRIVVVAFVLLIVYFLITNIFPDLSHFNFLGGVLN